MFAQANGEAERGVKTIKSLLEKTNDLYTVLLAYRSTPLQNGYSPGELLMSRKLRTTIPITSDQLPPKVPDIFTLKKREETLKNRTKENFDRRHRVAPLSILPPGTIVWVPNQHRYGTLVSTANPRSYVIQTPTRQIRRNRRSVNPLPFQTETQSSLTLLDRPQEVPTQETPSANDQTLLGGEELRRSDLQASQETASDSAPRECHFVTRSGRVSSSAYIRVSMLLQSACSVTVVLC